MTLSFVSGRTHTWTFSLSFVLVVHSDIISKKQSSILWRSQGRSSSSWWDHPPQSYQAQTLHLYPSGFRHFIHFKTHSYSEGSRSLVWSPAQGPDSQHFMNLQWVWRSGLLGRGCHPRSSLIAVGGLPSPSWRLVPGDLLLLLGNPNKLHNQEQRSCLEEVDLCWINLLSVVLATCANHALLSVWQTHGCILDAQTKKISHKIYWVMILLYWTNSIYNILIHIRYEYYGQSIRSLWCAGRSNLIIMLSHIEFLAYYLDIIIS